MQIKKNKCCRDSKSLPENLMHTTEPYYCEDCLKQLGLSIKYEIKQHEHEIKIQSPKKHKNGK